jgi:hypothetical protein
MTIWAWDLETYLIQKRDKAPKPVCASYSKDGNSAGICRVTDPVHRSIWSDPSNIIVGHNLSYDIIALLRWHPDYIPLVIRALSEGRVFDTMIRQAMIHLEKNGGLKYRPFISLDKLVMKYKGVDITESKKGEDSWRLRYGTLDYTPIEQWPTAAIEYALDDAKHTWDVFAAQGGLNNIQPTEVLQVMADVVLQAVGVWGFGVNQQKNSEMEVVQRELLKGYEEKIGPRGWWGTGSKKRLADTVVARFSYKQAMMISQVAPTYGCQFNWDVWQDRYQLTDLREHLTDCHNNQVIPEYIYSDSMHRVSYMIANVAGTLPGIPLTDKGAVKADEETFKKLYDVDPDLERLVDYRHEQKMLSTYIRPFSGIDAIHPNFTNLNSTGRTSASPGVQTIPRKGGYRSQFCPRPGNKFGTVDYAALELCTLAAAIRHEYPNRRCILGEMIDQGGDAHSYTASLIVSKSYEEVLAGKKDVYKDARQGAKAGNFGFPGGLWINAFVAYAENNYGVKFSFDEAKAVRNAWSKAFPEIDSQYLKAHKKLCPRKNDRATSTLINGRSKANCVFTELSNFKFQGLAADGAKLALWQLWSEAMLAWYHQNIGGETYGYEFAGSPLADSRISNFVHDEIVMEHPDNEKGASAFERQKELMVSSMTTMCQSLITISVEGEFSEHWSH